MIKRGTDTDVKVGIFIAIGVALILAAIVMVGGTQTLFSSYTDYHAHFTSVDGLISGAKVSLNGIHVGVIKNVGLDPKEHSIQIDFSVSSKYTDWIRKDSTVEIATQGVLGDKYLSIKSGSPTMDKLPPGSEISASSGGGLSQLLDGSGKLVGTLNSIASSLERLLTSFEKDKRNERFFAGIADTAKYMAEVSKKLDHQVDGIKVKEAVAHLNSILKKIDNGEGSVGAFVNDRALYDDAKALIGGANRNRMVRNLVRKTIKDGE